MDNIKLWNLTNAATSATYGFTTTNTTGGWYCSYGNWHLSGYGCQCTGWHWQLYPPTVYVDRYQIRCPNCKKTNWLELDKTAACTKCSKTLKAVQTKVDYEIEVEK